MIAIHVDQERDTQYLGASEAPGVLGLDKHNPPIKIWRRHRGLDVGDDHKPPWLQEAADWGQVLEPVIRGKYAVRNNRSVMVPTMSMGRDGWLRCTPDGLVMDDPPAISPGTREWSVLPYPLPLAAGLVQCKNVDAHLAHEWKDGPPPAKEVQVRVEMAVTGLPWCDLVALIGGNRYVQHRVERDLEIEARILRDLRAFWTLVETGEEPTVDHTDAWRLHIADKMPIARMTGEASEGDAGAMARFRDARAARKTAIAKEEFHRNEILLRMSARGITALRHPVLGTLSAYQTKGRTWALRSPPQWGDE